MEILIEGSFVSIIDRTIHNCPEFYCPMFQCNINVGFDARRIMEARGISYDELEEFIRNAVQRRFPDAVLK
ncbi:MAG: hypothetical protein FWG68_04405 [Defluviitaleaceae bacterium]|nr:hypothetical protein [Defluviitaleaceae bacterium]